MKELVTERLILRKFRQTDVKDAFQNYGQASELGRFLPMYPMKSIDEMSQLLQGYMNENIENAQIYAVELKESSQVIGEVILSIPYPALQVAELSYLLGPHFWGKGYAKEAVAAVIQAALSTGEIHLIEAKYNENNQASGLLLERLGFKKEAKLRDRRVNLKSGKWNDLVICSITKDEIEDSYNSEVLLENLDSLHTTQMGVERIKRNLGLDVEDVICWCKKEILKPNSIITRNGKNWYIQNDNRVITMNAHSYTVITAHQKRDK